MELMAFVEHNWFQITLMISLIAFAVKMTNKLNEYISKIDSRFDDVETKYDNLSKRLQSEEERYQDNQERTRLIMNGVEATLISLKNEGHNGPVTKSLNDINDYKSRKASE